MSDWGESNSTRTSYIRRAFCATTFQLYDGAFAGKRPLSATVTHGIFRHASLLPLYRFNRNRVFESYQCASPWSTGTLRESPDQSRIQTRVAMTGELGIGISPGSFDSNAW